MINDFKINNLISALGLIVISFALYSHTIHYDFFIFDDYTHVLSLSKNLSFSEVLEMWKSSNTPLILNFWQLETALFGIDLPEPYRIVSIFIHGVNSFLVFYLVKLFLTFYSKEKFIENISLFGAIVFLIHPINIESVVWISSQKDLIAMTFGSLSFIQYLKFHKNQKNISMILTIVFLVLSVLFKPSTAGLPIVYLSLEILFFKKSIKQAVSRYGFLSLIVLGVIIVHKTINKLPSLYEDISIASKALIVISSFQHYFFNLIISFTQSFDYQLNPLELVKNIKETISTKFLIFSSLGVIWFCLKNILNQKKEYITIPIVVFTGIVSVNLGLITYIFQNISTVADRYMYFPSIAISFLIAMTYCKYHKKLKKEQWSVVFIFIILAYGSLNIVRAQNWKSSETILKAGIDNGYKSYILYVALAEDLIKQRKFEESLFYAEKAIEIGPTILPAYLKKFDYLRREDDDEKFLNFVNEVKNSAVGYTPEFIAAIGLHYLYQDRIYKAEEMVKPHLTFFSDQKEIVDFFSRVYKKKSFYKITSLLSLAELLTSEGKYLQSISILEKLKKYMGGKGPVVKEIDSQIKELKSKSKG